MKPPTTTPRRWLALVLALLLVVVACGGDDDDTESASEGTTTTEATDDTSGTTETTETTEDDLGLDDLPSEEELTPALLTVEEFGEGWTEQPADDDDDDSALCGFKLTDLLELPADSLPNAEITVAQDPNVGPLVNESLGFVPEGRGEEAVELVREQLAACNDTQQDGLDTTVVELAFEPLGDESAAYLVGLSDPESGDHIEFHIAYVRDGDLLVTVATIDEAGNGEQLLNEWAPRAYEKAADTLL